MHPALLARVATLPVKLAEPQGVEFCVREVKSEILILAARREGDTVKVKFTGLPEVQPEGTVLFEEPRKVQVKGGGFEDWFGPNEVHVYGLKRGGTSAKGGGWQSLAYLGGRAVVKAKSSK